MTVSQRSMLPQRQAWLLKQLLSFQKTVDISRLFFYVFYMSIA